MNLEVRRAVASDAPKLARMRVESAVERRGGGDASRAEFERRCAAFFATELAKPDAFLRSWVAILDGIVVGGASLAILPTLPRYGHAFTGIDGRVRDVYVAPQHRRGGIARALMRAVIADAKALGVDRLSLGASDQGRPLYDTLGFVAKLDEMVLD